MRAARAVPMLLLQRRSNARCWLACERHARSYGVLQECWRRAGARGADARDMSAPRQLFAIFFACRLSFAAIPHLLLPPYYVIISLHVTESYMLLIALPCCYAAAAAADC